MTSQSRSGLGRGRLDVIIFRTPRNLNAKTSRGPVENHSYINALLTHYKISLILNKLEQNSRLLTFSVSIKNTRNYSQLQCHNGSRMGREPNNNNRFTNLMTTRTVVDVKEANIIYIIQFIQKQLTFISCRFALRFMRLHLQNVVSRQQFYLSE